MKVRNAIGVQASWGLALVSLLASCEGDPGAPGGDAHRPPAPIVDCSVSGRSEPICGFENPEDLVALPGNRALIVSEYGDIASSVPGSIALLRIASRERIILFRGGRIDAESAPGWGSPDCPGPPGASFSPHGIDLVRRDDGRLQLLAVQHGGRESIEFFEVRGEAEAWQVEWRGCLLAPEDASLNDVVGIADGTLFTTKITSLSGGVDFSAPPPENDTGQVYGWSVSRGYWIVPGTSGKMPNGVQATPDGKTLFMNASLGNEVRKLDVATGELLGRAAVAFPDNVTWTPDAESLLVASLGAGDLRDFIACENLEAGACPISFQIIEVDAETMATSVLFDSVGSPMGAGTVGLRVGDDLFIGSFRGDRILRVDLR